MKKRLLAMLMALVLVLSCLPTWSVAAEGEHIHCQCGKETTLDATCASCGTKAVKWTGVDALPTESGHYYLTKGVSTAAVEYKNNAQVSICLHGNDITSASGGQILITSGGAQLTVTDCAQEPGKITGASTYQYGSAVRVKKNSTFILYGGKISGNTAPTAGDGTVYLDQGDATNPGGYFYMYGGEISDNTARRGTGIFVANPSSNKAGSAIILGGRITGNHAKGTGSTKGGGAILSFGTVVVGGDAYISGNTAAEGPADIYVRNSGSFKGKVELSAEKPLMGGAQIGVGSDTEATDDPNNITCITGAPAQWSSHWMTYAGQSVSYVGGKFVAGHYHGDQLYTPITNNTELSKAEGYGYLTTDLNLGGEQTRGKNLHLCLNGHTIKAKANKRIFTTAKNAGITFYIEDCTAYTDAEGVYHAGKLTGGSNTGVNGGGAIYLAAGNTLHLEEGIFTGNSATVHGGAMTIFGTLYVSGGQICGNSAPDGAGIFAAADAQVYLTGNPQITDNGNSNLYISGDDLLSIDSLEATARIGISAEVADRAISQACADYTGQIFSDDTAFKVAYRDGVLTLDAPITHNHCVCNTAGCTDHETLGFVEWKSATSLPGSGNYCLTTDVTLSSAVSVSGELNLCLNGHTITQTGTDRVFKLDVGPLTITDCAATPGKLVGGTNDYGAAIVVMEGTTFNLYNGTITGSQPANPDKAGTGAAIFLRSSTAAGATFNMYGGEITGNGDHMTWGGAVTNGSGSATNSIFVNIYGGKIHGNTAGTGGGIRMANKAVLTITGGEISDNTADTNGGAIYLTNGAQLNLQGGTITGNNAAMGGGIYVFSDAGTVTLSGAPVVFDNTADGKQSNLYLNGDQTLTVGTLENGAKIGISAAKSDRAISAENDTDYSGSFLSDSSYYGVIYKEKTLFLELSSKHTHCLCNSTLSACDHAQQKWMVWDSANSLPTTSGYYYLANDVQLTATVKAEADQKIYLCLNGKTVKAAENAGHYILSNGTVLSITDCGEGGGFTGGNKAYGGFANVVAGATMNLYAGSIYGNQAPGAEGGAIYLQAGTLRDGQQIPGGIFNMYGGKIYGNTAGVGGAIRAAGVTNGGEIGNVINIYGGEISGNKALCKLSGEEKTQGTGGAIAAIYGSQVNIFGGKIHGNSAEADGGALYINNKAVLNIQGGKLEKNIAGGYGGAVFMTSPETVATMDGGELLGNEALAGGAVMMQTRSVFTMNEGLISGNKAVKSGGGAIYVSTNTDFVLNGGKITENHTASSGGAIYALRSRVKLNGGEISGNVAVNRGGAIVTSGAQLEINKATISGNSAKEGGAGYFNRSTTTAADGTQTHYPSAVTINEGAVITGNKAETNSGGFIVANPDVVLTMNGGEMTKNTAASGGAVMTWTGATFVMKGGKLSENKATGSGGALYISTDSTFQMEGGQIANNTAGGNGGGIYCLASKITMTGGTISGNTATSAGAIFLLRATGRFTGGSVSNNIAKVKTSVSNGVEKSTGGTAGAMYISGAQVQLAGTAFTGNKAETNGGAIVLGRSTYTKNGTKLYSDAKLDIYGGTFSGNYATKVGGCMLIQSTGTVVNMTGGTITGNSSGNSAGGIYASTNTTFTMTGGAIVKNSSTAAGGGIYALRSKVTITGGELHSNTAATSGAQMVAGGDTAEVYLKDMKLHSGTAKIAGAVVIQSDAKFTAENCEFYDNVTNTNSGAVYVSNRTSATFVGCKFYNNQTLVTGGALTVANFGQATITDCEFTGNKAGNHGGAIYVNPASLTTITNTTISNCAAEDRGGAIACRGSMFIYDSVIENCTAGAEGGAIYTDTNTAGGSGAQRGLVIEGTQISGNTSGGKGGAFYIYKGCRLELYDCSITDNTAPAEGGAIWAYEDLELHNTQITGNSSGGDGYAVFMHKANYDGHSYFSSLNKLSGSVIIKDNQGGNLWMDEDVVFAIVGTGLGEDTHIQLVLDSGVVTNRIQGAYNYEGGDQVYTITYGTRSMTEPEHRLMEEQTQPTEESQLTESQTTEGQSQPTGEDSTFLYVAIAGVAAVIVLAAVVVVIVKKKKAGTAGKN